MSPGNEASQDFPPTHSDESADGDATRYRATPSADAVAKRYSDVPADPADPEDAGNPSNTRYSDASADPDATDYTPNLGASDLPAVSLPRRFGNYELLEELGRGAMGVVYKARQLGLNRVVALKMILSGVQAGQAELARFRAEAEAVARLQHSNIVQIYEIGEADGRLFFSMEFCPGGSLDRSLNGTPLPSAEAARLTETLARAVHVAHRQSIVHRDLKPSNVLLAADGSARITDFGLAKRLDDVGHTQTGAVMGTPSYMAPEQAAGKTKEIGPAADVYALGAVLYECLTGRAPFRGPTTLETLRQVTETEPVPPRLLQRRTPSDLQTVCLKCLEKKPGLRYATALDLAEDLRRFQAGEPVRARPISRVGRAWRSMRRNPGKAMIWGLVLLALLLGGAYGVAAWQLRAARERTKVERLERLIHETREIGLHLLGEIRSQRSDTWSATQPTPNHSWDLPVLEASTMGLLGSSQGQGPLLAASAVFPERSYSCKARDLFLAVQSGAPRKDATNGLIQTFRKLFKAHPRYLRVSFLIRGQKESREVLRLESGANGDVTPITKEMDYKYPSEDEDHLGLPLTPQRNQLLLSRIGTLPRDAEGAVVPVLHTAAFVRKDEILTGGPLGLVVLSMDLSNHSPPSAGDLYFLTDDCGTLWDGPEIIIRAAGGRDWSQAMNVVADKRGDPKPFDKWDLDAWGDGYSYPTVRMNQGPFAGQTYAMHMVKIQYGLRDDERYLGVARLVSCDRMNQ